ncbi:MAG: RNA 2',3'-cyclic phosphodiesterase [Candidatus Omnitrophota bacterium]
MRTFVAIELPKEIKSRLGDIQEQLKKSGADVKWVSPLNIHLTLKFLGDIDDTKLNKINEILEACTKNKGSFKIRVSSLGAFPEIKLPRVIWMGIDKGDNETKGIAKDLEEEFSKIGIPAEDRPFSSHITIGRTRSFLNKEKLAGDLENLANNLSRENWEFTVGNITLFKSTLTPKGPIYETLKTASLKSA